MGKKKKRTTMHGLCLAALLFAGMGSPAAAQGARAQFNNMPVLAMDQPIAVEAYNINDYNYFKLRDVAQSLQGSEKSFDLQYNAESRAIYISTGQAYLSLGTELSPPQGGDTVKQAVDSKAALYIDGAPVSLSAYNIDGYTYYKLQDLGHALDFDVQYDEDQRRVLIECQPLGQEQPEEPEQPEKPEDGDNETDPTVPPEDENGEVDDDNLGDTGETWGMVNPDFEIIQLPGGSTDPNDPDNPNNPNQSGSTVLPGQVQRPNKTGSVVVMVDPGHGGRETGSINEEAEIIESEINYTAASRLGQLLTQAGYQVVFTRGEGETLSLSDRMELIRRQQPDLVVSVHHNATEEHTAYGAEVLAQVADKQGGPTKQLAQLINQEYEKLGQSTRPIVFRYNSAKTGDYYGLLRAAASVQVPAVISEFAFIDHPQDIQKIDTDEELWQEAEAIFRAVDAFLGGPVRK